MADSVIVDLKQQGVKDLIDNLGLASKGLTELDKGLIEANKQLLKLEQGSEDFKKLSKEINAANTAITAYGQSTDTLKKELRETTNEIGNLDRAIKALEKTNQTGTDSYKNLVKEQDNLKKKAGELKDTINDLNEEIKTSGSDTKNLDKALRAIGAVAAGYQVAQGALALFGSENKKFEQALLKLNAVMAITNGLQQIQAELSRKDSLFTQAATKAKTLYAIASDYVKNGISTSTKEVAKSTKEVAKSASAHTSLSNAVKTASTGTTLLTTAQKASETATKASTVATATNTVAIGASSVALQVFRFALLATGIGIFVVALGYLITNFSKLKESILGSTQSLEDFRKKQDEIRSANKQSFDDYETEIRYLVNIKQLTQEAADLKLSIKRKEAEASLKAVYDENTKKLQEYEQAIRNVTFAKDDGITMSELEVVRSQQKYIPSQKELTEQKRITKEAEIDYMRAVNDRIKADEKGVVVAKKVVQSNKEIVKSIEEIDMVGLQYGVNSEKYIQDQISLYTELRSTLEIGSDAYISLGEVIDAFRKKLAGKQKIEPIDLSDALKGINKIDVKKEKLTLWEMIFGSKQENQDEQKRTENLIKGALKIVTEINAYGDKIANIASQAISIRANNEIAVLEERKEKGLISQKEFEKESAKIKNEAAQKQRAVDIAMAVAMIPQAALSAFVGTPGGMIVKGIAAALATAFAVAQVAIIASTPLPKFKHGGQVSEKLGLIKGNRHQQGGVPIEVEGDEYVMPVKETRENLDALKAIHKGKFKELYIPKSQLIQPDIFANIPNPATIDSSIFMDKDDYSSINSRLDKVASELWWLTNETKKGNKLREKGTEKMVKAVQSKSKRYV